MDEIEQRKKDLIKIIENCNKKIDLAFLEYLLMDLYPNTKAISLKRHREKWEKKGN